VHVDGSNKNKGTQMQLPHDPRASLPEAAGLFARAAAYLPRSPRFGAEHGYRIFWLERGQLRFRDVVADPRGFAIVGRHSRAHVRLAHDETIALRHLVLRAQRSAAGVTSLRVADLLAPLPLFVDGSDEPLHACVIEGAFSARLGAYALCGLPFDGCAALGPEGGPGRGDRNVEDDDDDDDAENADDIVPPGLAVGISPPTGTIDRARIARDAAQRGPASEAGAARPAPLDEPPAPSRPEPPLPAPKMHSVISARPRTTFIAMMPSSLPEDAVVTLALEGPRGRDTVHLAAEQLDGFLVLGRYDRCRAGGEVFSDRASRMHVALTLDEDGLVLIDLASTNGVFRDGAKIRHARVRDTEVFAFDADEVNRMRVTVHAGRR
jgi:hypothetical protein